MEEPEPATIRAAMAGDIDAFEDLVRAYQLPVWRFLRHLLNDEHLAEDVTQETFLRLYRHLPTFAFRAKFSTWTMQVARNAGIDALRARDRRDRLADALPDPGTAPGPGLGHEIGDALASLTPRLREPLLLVEVFGMTYAEAAVVLDVPVGTVKSRVFNARAGVHAWFDATEQIEELDATGRSDTTHRGALEGGER